MIPLYPVNKQCGGLQVVPKSNNDECQDYLRENYGGYSDWVELDDSDKYIGTGKLLIVEPGSLILWDSRTIHGGYVGKGPFTENERLSRLSVTVTMTPISKWDKEKNPNLLIKRMGAVEKGCTTSHWPHEFYP